MPQLEALDAMDVSMLEQFRIQRRIETIDATGDQNFTTQYLTARGVITLGTPNDETRDPDFTFGQKNIEVVTRIRLRSVAETINNITYQPDIVLWRSDSYLVRTVEDRSAFGPGWVVCECSSQDLADDPPQHENGNDYP
jgi:hypothetical protein